MLNLIPPTRETPRVEIYNDVNENLGNLFWVLQNHPLKLQKALAVTPYSKAEFLRAAAWNSVDATGNVRNRVEWARQTFVELQQSQGGRCEDWSRTKSRTRRGIADVVSGWLRKIHESMPEIVERITEWQLEEYDVCDCIRYHDAKSTMFYIDPTYLPEVRATPVVYKHEMTREQHEDMLKILVKAKGFIMISGYDSALYRK
jgi:DNA adenine methylase